MNAPAMLAAADSGSSLRERTQVLDDGWLLMLLAAALSVGVPWFLRNANVDLGPVSWAVFIYGLAYLAFSRGLEQLTGTRARMHALTLMQMAAVVFVAFLWHLAGSLQNPLFLMLFALPVAAAGCVLPGARPYLLAALSVACATLVALGNAPQLRWYMTQLGIPVDAIPAALLIGGARPFTGVEMPAAYLFLLLVTFAILIFAVALLSQSVASLLRGVYARLDAATRALAQAHALAHHVIEALPHPTVLVYADTRMIAGASASFRARIGLDAGALEDKTLFDAVAFTHPEVVAALIAAGQPGEAPLVPYATGGELRLARVRVAPVEHDGTRYACLGFEDVAESLFQKAALEAVPDPILVVGGGGRVDYFNAAAAALFEELEPGADAAATLAQDDAPDWWVLGPRLQRERPVTVRGRPHLARCTALALPGLPARATVVRLRAMGP